MATSVLMKATTRLLLGATAVVRAVGANAQVPATVAGPTGSMMNPMAMMNQPGARAPMPGTTLGYRQQAPAQGLMSPEPYTQWFGEAAKMMNLARYTEWSRGFIVMTTKMYGDRASEVMPPLPSADVYKEQFETWVKQMGPSRYAG